MYRKIELEIPAAQSLPIGVHHIKACHVAPNHSLHDTCQFVTHGDHTCVDSSLVVLSPLQTQAVVFSIDCAFDSRRLISFYFISAATFADSLSLSGADPRLRPGSVDVARCGTSHHSISVTTADSGRTKGMS